MTPLADLIRSMAADGCTIETIAKAVEAAEIHAQKAIDCYANNVDSLRRQNVDKASQRTARWRAKKRRQVYVDMGGTIGGEVLPLKKVKKEKSVSLVATVTPVTPSRFPDFKAAYPKRKGSYDWCKAEKVFNKLVEKEGVDPETLIAGAESYARQQEALEKVGTEYVKMPMTWLNARGWEDGEEIGDTWEQRVAASLRAQGYAGHH